MVSRKGYRGLHNSLAPLYEIPVPAVCLELVHRWGYMALWALSCCLNAHSLWPKMYSISDKRDKPGRKDASRYFLLAVFRVHHELLIECVGYNSAKEGCVCDVEHVCVCWGVVNFVSLVLCLDHVNNIRWRQTIIIGWRFNQFNNLFNFWVD